MRVNHNHHRSSNRFCFGLLFPAFLAAVAAQSSTIAETPRLGWGVILLIILFSLSFIFIIFGFCIDKPVAFILVGLLVPVLVLIILKLWPKENVSQSSLSSSTLSNNSSFSVYDMYKDKKNYRVGPEFLTEDHRNLGILGAYFRGVFFELLREF